jgi:hypothetical protein
MNTNSEPKSGSGVDWRRLFLGISLILTICASQWCVFFWMLPRWLAGNPVGMLGVPVIVIPGLLANWFMIARFVAVGGSAPQRFIIGLLGSLFLAFVLVAVAIDHMNHQPPTYHGP